MTLTRKLSAVIVLFICALGLSSSAQTLKLGDAAPTLDVGKWIKGEPVKKFEPGKVYVIECWATWCGPCRQAIPHVTELQKKYEGKVVFIGQNVWEEDESGVPAFVTEMGDKMGYRVALDDKTKDPKGAMAKTWLDAAGQHGIPCSFIVNQEGKVAWIGHPLAMEEALGQIVAGKFDIAKAAEEAKHQAEKQEAMQASMKKFQSAVAAKDVDGAMKAIDEIAASNPALAAQVPAIKFQSLVKMGEYQKAYAMSGPVYDAIKDNAGALNDFAWTIATDDSIKTRDLKLAQKFAERAAEVSKREDPAMLDTLARIYFDQGEAKKAIDTESEAVSKADEKLKPELSATLAKYKDAKAAKSAN